MQTGFGRNKVALPIYSIVVPMHGTARYLPALLDSLERQAGRGVEFGMECLFIDDASPDDAAKVARDWLQQTGIDGHVIEQPNGGVSAARNNGLDHATGDWIAFIDSDDFLSHGYVQGVHRFLQVLGPEAESISLVSCNVARYFEEHDRVDHAHPLRDKFNAGNRVYPLDEHPQFIQSQAASGFFPVARLRRSGVRFLEKLHASEDALFVSSYLLAEPRPTIACVTDSDYYYRQRASGDSAVNKFTRNPDYYFARFRRGYLPLFERARRERGEVPRWLGQYFLYDMRWFFPRERRAITRATHLTSAERAEVIELVSSILGRLHPSWIRDYSITGMDLELRDVLLGLMGAPLLSAGTVQVQRVDEPRGLVQLRYRFTGDEPREEVQVAERPAEIVAAKTRMLDYFDQRVVRERVLWVRAEDELAVRLDAREQQLLTESRPHTAFTATRARLGFDRYRDPVRPLPPAETDRPLIRRAVGRARREAAAIAPRLFSDARLRSLGEELRGPRVSALAQAHAQRPGTRARLRHSWLFHDGSGIPSDASDALYWHVRRTRPEVNAHIVVPKDSPRWRKLRDAGARVIADGSVEHRAALLHADFVITCGLDADEFAKIRSGDYWDTRIPWRLIRLQRGALRDEDILLLSLQPVALFAVRTDDDRAALTADDTSSPLTALDAVTTGVPGADPGAGDRVLHAIDALG